jgi:hypothetical protein
MLAPKRNVIDPVLTYAWHIDGVPIVINLMTCVLDPNAIAGIVCMSKL